jgi:cell division septal protein FtsQ
MTDSGLEVRIGQDNTKARIELLEDLLNQTKNELNKIKYIDLRFKDPAIKFK